MSKVFTVCPFSHRACSECALNRGKHYYIDFNQKHRKCVIGDKDIFDFNSLPFSADRDTGKGPGGNGRKQETDPMPDIKLRVINLVTEEENSFNLSHAKDWDWADNNELRLINGSLHVTSWAQLLDYCTRKTEQGDKEVVVYESPGYMMISGG